MNNEQNVLTKILSEAIRGRRPPPISYASVNWTVLRQEALAHDVDALIYPAVKELHEQGCGPEDSLMTEWEIAALTWGIRQIQDIRNISEVLGSFNHEGIPVLLLKGLVLRQLYAQPELRSMSDFDILVSEEHYAGAAALLEELGYTLAEFDAKHKIFIHKYYLSIELHRALSDNENWKAENDWCSGIWDRCIPIKLNGTASMTLSPEDQFIHICLHMADHCLSYGFGLRQLCDLVLLVEKKGEAIDWGLMQDKLEALGLECFVTYLFLVCKRLFSLEIPMMINPKNTPYDPVIGQFIEDIFSGGIYGMRTMDREITGAFLHYAGPGSSDKIPGVFRRFAYFIFPGAKMLGDKYSYAREHPALLPVAWLHRLAYSICRKDFILSEKTAFLFSAPSQELFEDRSKLLRHLGLR